MHANAQSPAAGDVVWQDGGEQCTAAFALAWWWKRLRPSIAEQRVEIGDEDGFDGAREAFDALIAAGDVLLKAANYTTVLMEDPAAPGAPLHFADAVSAFLDARGPLAFLFPADRDAALTDARALDRGAALLLSGRAVVVGDLMYRKIVVTNATTQRHRRAA